MAETPIQEPPAQELSSGSGQTLPSRPLQPISDPSASKRVCFYKSGDYKFSGHRMVINARTFKTFDALLDALSKKVPLPFGVRTITTPRGTHLVKALEDLHDGGSYVCSDQKRVKPLNLDEVNRRQVPWNTTRPLSAARRRRQGLFGRRNEVFTNRPARVTERVAVRTPKRLVVVKNRDPTVKRTIVLQRRTAPTFDALLDYLSQILQFPVLKLFSTDGRRIDGLAGLILCSGVVVAAGNEPFRLGKYSFQGAGQMAQVMYIDTAEPSMLQPRTQNNKSFSSGRGSRNFSLSSERYIVNQINKSRNGSTNGPLHRHNRSYETEVNHRHTSVETYGTGQVDMEHQTSIGPHDDDIEKSFRVNQDGSMTVEMKVRLTIKEEEMLHWTTTLSRSSLSKGTICASVSESGNSSPDSNNAFAKDSSSMSDDEMKEDNHPAGARNSVCFNDERGYEDNTSKALGKAKTGFKRTPTPGPRHVTKKASVESVKTVTETGVQEKTLGHYSYMERTADGETTEGYCIVRHSSSSTNRPIPKPRKTASAGARQSSYSSLMSSGGAEVLQIQNNGTEVTETVMHIYESQGCYDNYLANEDYGADGKPLNGSTPAADSKPSPDSEQGSSSNDCDIDFSWQPPTTGSLQRQKEEMLSLSSEPITSTNEVTGTSSQIQETIRKGKSPNGETKKKMIKPSQNKKSSSSTSSSDKKQKESIVSPSKNSKHSSPDKLSSSASVGKKTLSSSESAKSVQKYRGAAQIKKAGQDEKTSSRDQALLIDSENVRKTPPKRQNISKAAGRENGHNVNTPSGRPPMKKNISDILKPKKSLLPGKKMSNKTKSMTENRTPSPKKSLELGESLSMPSLNPSPAQIHQYVENWLEKVSPDPVPYSDDIAVTEESESRTKVVFQIGGDTESDDKSDGPTHVDEYHSPPEDAIKKSPSCLSVPHFHEAPTLVQNEQYLRGLCASMPTVRVDPVHKENRLRPHKSAEELGAADNESPSSTSHDLDTRANLKPILRELYSSIHCIRSATEISTTSNLEKSNSLPDFSKHVALVFGSSCKAFMSFLSVMTLRDHLTGSTPVEGNLSRSSSEAMLMMESLQKISAVEDEDELRASLTDLQSRASSQLRERWKDFQIMRERLESEPLSPRVSETEFALDVVSEVGDAFDDIDELMDELNMPQDLRAEISSVIQQAKSFYPLEESTFVETERNPSDTEEDVEKFDEEYKDDTKQSPEPDTIHRAEGINQTKQGDDKGETDNVKEMPEQGDREGEEEAAEEAEAEENMDDEGQKESEVEKVHAESEESIQVVEERSEEEMRVDEKEEGEEAEEELTDEDIQGVREGDSVEETDEREGAEETEVEERGEGVLGDEERKGEELGTEERQSEEDANEEVEESDDGEEVGNIIEEVEEEEEEVDEVSGEANERQEVKSIEELEEEEQEEIDVVIGEKNEGQEIGTEEVEEEEEEQEEGEECIEETNEGEEVQNIDVEEEEDEAGVIIGETNEGEEIKSVDEVEEEEEDQEEADEVIGVTDDVGKVGNIEVEGEEEEKEADEEGEEENVIEEVEEEEEEEEEEASEGEEVENVIGEEEEEEEEEEEADVEDEAEEGTEVIEGESNEEDDVNEVNKDKDEDEDEDENVENVIEEIKVEEEEEEETEVVTSKDVEEAVIEENEDVEDKDEEVDKTEVVIVDNNEEEEEDEEVGVKDGGDVEVIDIEERGFTDEEEEGEDSDKSIGEEEKCDDGAESRKDLERTVISLEEESEEEEEGVEEIEEHMETGQMPDEEEREDNEDGDSLDKVEELKEVEEDNATDETDSITGDKNLLEEAAYLQQQSSFDGANIDAKEAEHNSESPAKSYSEVQCEDDKGNGTDTVNEIETDEGEETLGTGSSSVKHPVEISQELLDFVNSALQSSSLIFTYDARGNIRIEPDNVRVTQTTKTVIPKSRKDNSYGLKRLPSPSTSDLSDYRPETSESGGYKTQDSVDIVTDSGEETSPIRHKTNVPTAEEAYSKLSAASNAEVLQKSPIKNEGSFSSCDSDTKASKEDLSYFSAASSLKAEAEPVRPHLSEAAQCDYFTPETDLADGVLIDQGRWLLKENHLIRKSPPLSQGMYGQLDSTSLDTGQDNTSEDSPTHSKAHQSPLAAISSSELEEMAKPQTPKCNFFNMSHGSDSDPFLDDSSVKSGKKDTSVVKGRGFRVSPTIDTSKTWASKNGSLSSFTSVEFKIPDRKVHPEGESSAVARTRRTSSGGRGVVQAQDSLETLHVRCGQYCPIL